MPTLPNYQQFDGLHWETGCIRNALDYQGVKAPHTGQPFSEALLFGVSGGAVFGYFSFAYEGHDPHVALLTRNTFDPWDTLLARLGVVQEVYQTIKPDKAVKNLLDVLETGAVPIVWADFCSMPYNSLHMLADFWHMYPHIVYGYEPADHLVRLADRARVPLQITPEQLAAARGRVKKADYRIVTLDLPDSAKLISAVQLGIWDCIKLYTEQPPKGAKHNFGFAAYQRWIELLAKPKVRLSWAREFPVGPKLYAGLTSTWRAIMVDGKEGQAERHLFADFLDEASVILNKVALKEVATQFRASGQAWHELANALLPERVPLFKQARELMWTRYQRFLNYGYDPAMMAATQARLNAIKTELAADFPLTDTEVAALHAEIAAHVRKIHDLELVGINTLRLAMGER